MASVWTDVEEQKLQEALNVINALEKRVEELQYRKNVLQMQGQLSDKINELLALETSSITYWRAEFTANSTKYHLEIEVAYSDSPQ